MKENYYNLPHPVQLEEHLFVIENEEGEQIFDKEFYTHEEAQAYIDKVNWYALTERLRETLEHEEQNGDYDDNDEAYDRWKELEKE